MTETFESQPYQKFLRAHQVRQKTQNTHTHAQIERESEREDNPHLENVVL